MQIEVKNFKGLLHVLDYFKEEKTCKEYLATQRWGNTPTCHHCGTIAAYVTNRGYRCRSKECGKKFTVITGTIMENTKIPLRLWFAALYLVSSHKKGISSLQLAKHLYISQPSAWFLLHRIRIMLTDKKSEKLKGIVEVDETYIGGKEKNKHKKKQLKEGLGRGIDKKPVIAMVARNGDVRAFATNNVQSSVIYDLIVNNIDKSSTLITDGYNAYNFVGRQYNHISVKHEEDFITYGDHHTNGVEGFFSHLKRMIIGTYHYISPKHLNNYCQELTYRFNTRKSTDAGRFSYAIGLGEGKRLRYVDLVGKKSV